MKIIANPSKLTQLSLISMPLLRLQAVVKEEAVSVVVQAQNQFTP